MIDPARNVAETWLPAGDGTSALFTIDLDLAWLEVFAQWDTRVDTDTAARIATATIAAIKGEPAAVVPSPPKPRRKAPALVPSTDPIDTSKFTDAELFAHYKRIAPAEDLRFILRTEVSAELRARAEAIAKPTAKDISGIRIAWRTERNERDRRLGIPAIGSPAWREALEIATEELTVAAS